MLFASSTMAWVHSFEHIHLEGETECEYGIYANITSSELPEIQIPRPALLQETLEYPQQLRQNGLNSLKFPFRNKAPPSI